LDIWNVRSLYTSGSGTEVAGEVARYRFDLVGLQVVGRDE